MRRMIQREIQLFDKENARMVFPCHEHLVERSAINILGHQQKIRSSKAFVQTIGFEIQLLAEMSNDIRFIGEDQKKIAARVDLFPHDSLPDIAVPTDYFQSVLQCLAHAENLGWHA